MTEPIYPTDLASMAEAQAAGNCVPSRNAHPIHWKPIDGHFRAYLYVPREGDGDIPEFGCVFIPTADLGLYEEHGSNRTQRMLIEQRKRMSLPLEDFCVIPYVQRKATT